PAGSQAARERFRVHPSRVALATLPSGAQVAVAVEPRVSGPAPGRLIVLDVRAGTLLADVELAGRGYRFVMPLVVAARVYLPTCESNAGPSRLEGYRLY